MLASGTAGIGALPPVADNAVYGRRCPISAVPDIDHVRPAAVEMRPSPRVLWATDLRPKQTRPVANRREAEGGGPHSGERRSPLSLDGRLDLDGDPADGNILGAAPPRTDAGSSGETANGAGVKVRTAPSARGFRTTRAVKGRHRMSIRVKTFLRSLTLQ